MLGAFVVVGYGLSERFLPGLVELDRSFAAAGRLEQPLTYWNAFGLLAALGLVLAVRIAGDADRPGPLRGAAAAAGVVLGLGAYLTFGRGALAAVAAGLLVLIALAPDGRFQLLSAAVVAGAAGLAALLATRYPTVKTLVEGPGRRPGGGGADADRHRPARAGRRGPRDAREPLGGQAPVAANLPARRPFSWPPGWCS